MGKSDVKWDYLLKWRENRDIIIAYLAPRLYYLIPERVSEMGFDIVNFKQLLREKLGPPV